MVMAILMVVSLLPLGVFAEDGDATCNCTAKCAEGSMNGECPVCGAEGAQLDACLGQSEAPQPVLPVCTCTTKCAEGSMNEECPVCGVEGAQLDSCLGRPEAPQPVPLVCNCTAKCHEGAMNGECPVCGAEGFQLDACLGQLEAPQPFPPVCNCTAKCAEGSMNGECPVCGMEGALPDACAFVAEGQGDDPVCEFCDGPHHTEECTDRPMLLNEPAFSGGDGTDSNPYLISSVADLQTLATDVNSGTSYSGQYFQLTQNLDLSGEDWTPIGNSSYSFQGTFDGGFHTIYGLTINASSRYCGLFGRLYNATICNLGLESVNIVSSYNDVAALAGNAQGGLIERCYVTGSVKGKGAVSGILGSTHSSSYPTQIENCYARVALTYTGYTDDIAGISGWNESTSVKITNSYSACIGEVRPIAGWSDGGAVQNTQFVSTYFDNTLSPDFSTASGRTDLGRTSNELKTQTTFSGWVFDSIWAIDPAKNGGYPYLQGFTPGLGGAPGSVTITVKDDNGNPVTDATVVLKKENEADVTLGHEGNGVYSGTVTTSGGTYDVYVNDQKQGQVTQSGSSAATGSVTAPTVPAGHTHPICGAGCTHSGSHSDETWNEWNRGTSLPTNAGSYYLTQDVTLSSTWEVTQNINLCLNGHDIRLNGSFRIKVTSKTLTLTDCSDRTQYGYWSSDTYTIADAQPANDNYDTLIGGVITGGGSSFGGVYVTTAGTFNLYSGNIAGNVNNGNSGGGVMLGGSFNMYGGSITGNKSSSNGGGVGMRSNAVFTMDGGSIANNISTGENTNSNNGGGVSVDSGTFYLKSGSITNNKAGVKGDGVFVGMSGTFQLYGGSIAPQFSGQAADLYLENRTIILIGSGAKNNSPYKVAMQTPSVLTSGWGNADGYENCFVSADSRYAVKKNDSGELMLHQHSFTIQNTGDVYLKSSATCTSPAVYYKSCSCGEKGTATFTSGVALGHNWGGWTHINDTKTHKRICSRDSGHIETDDCAFTSAVISPTETSLGYTRHTCKDCGYYYDDTFTKVTNSITSLTLEGWTYGQSANTPSATAAYGTIVYAYSTNESGPFNSTVPTDAGTYYVKATVPATDFYDEVSETLSFTIAKAPVSFSVTNDTHSYDGTGKTATVTQTAGQTPAIGSQFTVSYKQGNTPVTPKNVGSYEIWVTLTSTNFKFDGKADTNREMQVGELTISTAAYPQIDWPKAGSLTYGQTLADSTLTSSESGGTFQWKEPGTIPTVSNSGYTVVFKPNDPGYQREERTILITVSPKELTITGAAATNRVYEPGNTAVTVSGGTLEGIVTGDSVTLVATGVSGKVASADAGQNKPVTVTGYALDGSGKGNYTLVQPDNVTVTITPAVGSGSVTMADWTYGDAARNPVPTSGTNGTANISYRYTNRTGTPYYDSVTCPTNAGDYTVTATFAATNNYRQVSATADFTISKATPVIHTDPTASDITYGQSLRDSTLTDGVAKNPYNQTEVSGTFTWQNGNETLTVCGSISRNVNFTPDDTRNYNSTSTTITLTVNKATPDAPGTGDGYAIHYAGETITIDAGYEVFTAQTGGTPITGSISDYVGSTIYIRKAGTDTHTPSDWTAISVPARPNVPSTPRVVNRSDTSITVSTVEGQEYSLDGRTWQTGGTFTGLAASTEYTVYTRVKATGSSFASVSSSVSVTTKASAAAAPEVNGSYAVSTADGSKFTYTVTAVPGAEYSLDGISWQDGNVFDNLAPEGSYTFYVRFKETDTAMAGNAGSKTVTLRKLTTGSGSVTMDGWIYGETAKEPKPSSTTHGTGSVTYRYKGRNSTSYNESGECPTEAGDYTVTATFAATAVYEAVTAEANFTIAKATLTPRVAAVDSKIYDGSTAATGTLTLSGMVNGENPEATGTFAFADKNVGENKAVNVTDITLDDTWDVNYQLSTDKLYNVSTTAAINPKSLSVENVTVKNKPFDGTKDAEFQGTPSLSGVVEGDDVTLKNGTPSFKSDAVGVQTVYFTDFSLKGVDAANYSLTQPASVTAEITLSEKHLDLSGITTEEGGQIPNEVFIDGSPYPICGEGENAYLALSEGSILLTTHTEAITGEPGEMNKPYPDTMRVYRIVEKKDASGNVIGNEVEEISALYDLLKYAGCSIRIDGIQGIRMITSIDQSNKEKLLRQEGLAGYQLVEYGTVVSWADENANPTLTDCLKKGVAYGVGDRGVFQDPVFGVSSGRVQYTNVLINFTMEQCAQELAMRPYIILKDADGKQITLYGGTVERSIGYIAYQNRNVFQPGSGEYQYVWQIIHGVYGERFDENTQENGGNNG